MAGPARQQDPDASRRRMQRAFGAIAIAVVVLSTASLLSLLLTTSDQDAFGGGQGGAGQHQATFIDATSLILLTLGYLAGLALWAWLRKQWGMLTRQVVTAALMWLLVVLYLHAFGNFEFHRRDWNRVFGNVSVVLYAVTLSIGPLARLWSPAWRALAWRRETGIWATLAAVVHVVVYWEGTYGFAGWRRLFYVGGRTGDLADTLMGGTPYHVANVIGLVALTYGIVLMVTSNDASQRFFRSGWSWLMKRATTMWLLVLFHVWAFAYFVQGMGILRLGTLWISFFTVLVLQTAAFTKTVWMQHGSAPRDEEGEDGATSVR